MPKNNPDMASISRVGSVFLFFSLAVFFLTEGCAHYPVNKPLPAYDPDYGYKGRNIQTPAREDDLVLMMTFSGGGTRAAAFSYGVLEAIRDTAVGPETNRQRLLDLQ